MSLRFVRQVLEENRSFISELEINDGNTGFYKKNQTAQIFFSKKLFFHITELIFLFNVRNSIYLKTEIIIIMLQSTKIIR